ncbi:plastocyanin/azurin family copper-binding protein [Dictyobacter formicarum]|uniref:Blue (type 1) copper domain-containing protein n=1 Tax=Dictyobacter formicarum TaxID=2778368 RepID=A0ABQ3VC91_9CHLR|nr:plastocyanin/azurin family copper-binding protein [Dictyobacter formicarum]GHO83765.1 hypothetical protein KSZ_17710 [Dictyobacter formicarum]
MMIRLKRVGITTVCAALLTLLLAACSLTGSASSTGPNQVHMDNTSFVQSSITIKKGESITLVSDTLVGHTIANGAWQNGAGQPAQEAGAPKVDNVIIGGNSSGTIGPFNSAGSFKLYCTVHSGMNLTVIVH